MDIGQLLKDPFEVIFTNSCPHMGLKDGRTKSLIVQTFVFLDSFLPQVSVVPTGSYEHVKEEKISLGKHSSIFKRFKSWEGNFIHRTIMY
mmetsp:Transcript_88307/g.254685  ORF Transcript_88307/g.254685 Transcript_88307/m.254685 type:complete len:90 (-) Transcript_88307:17-286(-)